MKNRFPADGGVSTVSTIPDGLSLLITFPENSHIHLLIPVSQYIKDNLVNAGATYLDQVVVVDNSLITCRTPGDRPAFLPAIIAALAG